MAEAPKLSPELLPVWCGGRECRRPPSLQTDVWQPGELLAQVRCSWERRPPGHPGSLTMPPRLPQGADLLAGSDRF